MSFCFGNFFGLSCVCLLALACVFSGEEGYIYSKFQAKLGKLFDKAEKKLLSDFKGTAITNSFKA